MTASRDLAVLVCEARARQARSSERLGQAYYNALAGLHPDIARAINGTDADPFHDDQRLEAFLATFLVHREAEQ